MPEPDPELGTLPEERHREAGRAVMRALHDAEGIHGEAIAPFALRLCANLRETLYGDELALLLASVAGAADPRDVRSILATITQHDGAARNGGGPVA